MAAGGRLAVSWLLAALTVGGTSGSGDVLWPVGVTDMELWEMLDVLEPVIAGNPLRLSELGVRLMDMGQKRFASPQRYADDNGFTECKCRLECLASSSCLAFEFETGGRCRRFRSRGAAIEESPAGHNMQFKMLNAAIGDACRSDLECSRQTVNASCDLNTADNSTTCQCPGDFVPHRGACVDPMSLTTTPPTTTAAPTTEAPTTSEATEETTSEATAETTTAATMPTSVTPALVTEGSVSLRELEREAEWPCDEYSDLDDEACGFLAEYPDNAPALWEETVSGQCDLARGRCLFPAVLSTAEDVEDAGAPRIEMWRSAGYFKFRLQELFPNPADLTEAYVPGPSEPTEAWKYDCTTTDGTSTVLTGFLGVARQDETYSRNIPRDMDLILCTRFTETFLKVDPGAGEAVDISAIGEVTCPAGHVITGVWDSEADFLQPKKAKCSRLVTGSVSDSDCVMTGPHAASNVHLYWNACSQETGPSVVTGLQLSDVTGGESQEWSLRCCPAAGPQTSTSVV